MIRTTLRFILQGKVVMLATAAIALTCWSMWLAGKGPAPVPPPDEFQLASAADDVSTSGPTKAEDRKGKSSDESEKKQQPSDAQRVARLQRTIEADRKELSSIEKGGDDPDEEYQDSEADFKQVDAEIAGRRKQIQDLRREGKTQQADTLVRSSADLQSQWKDAKDRFDLAIQKRKALHEKAAILQKKIQQDSKALDELVGDEDPEGAEEVTTPHAATEVATNPSGAIAPAATATPKQPPSAEKPAEAAGDTHPATDTAEAAPQNVATGDSGEKDEPDPEVELAKKEAQQRAADAREAEQKVESVNERVEGLRKNIALEQQLLQMARTEADQAQEARTRLDQELQRTLSENPDGTEAVWEKIAAADQRYSHARDEVREIQDRLDELHGEFNGLHDEQVAALGEAKETHDEAEAAEGKLASLQNPFTPTKIIQWFLDHGPKLLTILFGTLILSFVAKLMGRQFARVVARSGSRGTAHERQNRALTLVGVFHNVASLALVTGGVLMALDEVGIPIGPLMGGAAVLGLAVAFGAQNLIRDYFSGFMVLLEDQYGINDVVKIGDVSGAVEKITLRITVLRDMEGAVHFIPHGSITRVTNMTHGWSRAVVEVGVAYKEDTDKVMRVLLDIGKEMRRDPAYGPLILDGPEMLGVDNLGDSSAVIKFFLKTQPLQRWPVRRELLRRIKRTFDELGIEIPFPQRTIHHRYNGNARMAEEPHADAADHDN